MRRHSSPSLRPGAQVATGRLIAAALAAATLLPFASTVTRAQAPNAVNLWSIPLSWRGDSLVVGTPVKLTHDDGTNSQPSFTPDGSAIVFSATRDTGDAARSDIRRLDFKTMRETLVTHTPENENSPTVTGRGDYVAVRWVPATLFRQYGLWRYSKNGVPERGLLPGPDTTGYYVPLGGGNYALTRPKSKTFTIALFDSARGTITDVDSGVPALPAQRIPGEQALSVVHIDSVNGHHEIVRLDLATRRITPIVPALVWREVHAWLPGHHAILMARGNALFMWRVGTDHDWRRVATFSNPELGGALAYVVSPTGDRLIVTSAQRVALGTMLRDSLGAGHAGASLTALILGMQRRGELAGYDVREQALLGFGADRLRHGTPADGAAVDTVAAVLFPSSFRAFAALGDARAAGHDAAAATAAYRRSLALNPRKTAAERAAADVVEKKIATLKQKLPSGH